MFVTGILPVDQLHLATPAFFDNHIVKLQDPRETINFVLDSGSQIFKRYSIVC